MARLLADDGRAESALQTAFARNPTNSFIATRLAKLQVNRCAIDDAISTFRASLAAGVADKQVHFGYAKLLLDNGLGSNEDLAYHLRRAFTEGDSNLEAQFWYARHLYVTGDVVEAQSRFQQLRDSPIESATKRQIRGEILDGSDVRRFSGTIERLELNYAFIIRDGERDWVYLHRVVCGSSVWNALRRGDRVWFSIGFNFFGATAFDVALQ